MEVLSAKNVSFTYPEATGKAIDQIDFTVFKGAFVVLCGASGSGKSTLLRLIKQDISPHGEKLGNFYFKQKPMESVDPLVQAKEIGMVFQDPDHQIVMDGVMEELLFGLENMGYSTNEMRKKIAEMVHFFGLNHLLDKKTSELSGGEKQLINLASILLLDPTVLLLDEPTAQLDPIAAKEFILTLERLNEEFGITIIIVEHRLEELFAIANKVIVLEKGEIAYHGNPRSVIGELANDQTWRTFLPSASLVYLEYESNQQLNNIPLTVREAKQWLENQSITSLIVANGTHMQETALLELKEIDFQYEKHSPLILNNLNLLVYQGEWLAVVGANGTGKSTLLKVITGIFKPQHGHCKYLGKRIKKMDATIMSYLPQNPALYFLKDTIIEEYQYIAMQNNVKNAEKRIQTLLKKFEMEHIQHRHPYDLSGGELQKAALVGTLIVSPSILLIDEPTKGLDPHAKEKLGELLFSLKEEGLTIIMVTHDVEFAAKYTTRCSMLFQGEITVTDETNSFFRENVYYTTIMNRISRNANVPSVVTLEEAKGKWNVLNAY